LSQLQNRNLFRFGATPDHFNRNEVRATNPQVGQRIRSAWPNERLITRSTRLVQRAHNGTLQRFSLLIGYEAVHRGGGDTLREQIVAGYTDGQSGRY
jgi:hypothetical protein